MATITNSQLTTGFMSALTNSAHDEFVNAVYNYLTASGSPAAALPESEPYTKALAAFKATKESEHKAFMLTKKDYASEDLKKANRTVTSLMTALRYALRGFALVPTDDANKRKAQELYQTIVTAKYLSNDGYKQKNAKISGVLTELNKAKDTLKTFGLDVVATQLEAANNTFANSISDRRAWKTAYRSTEKMKTARENSEATLQTLFDVIVGRANVEPQIELTQIVNWLASSITDVKKKGGSVKKTDSDKKGTSSTTKPVDKKDDNKSGTSGSASSSSEGKSGSSDSASSSSEGKSGSSNSASSSSEGKSEGSGSATSNDNGKSESSDVASSSSEGKS